MTQHEGACSRGGSGGVPSTCTAAVSKHETGTPPGKAAVSKHDTKSVTQHEGACSRGGSGGVVPPPARLLCPSTRQVL